MFNNKELVKYIIASKLDYPMKHRSIFRWYMIVGNLRLTITHKGGMN